MKNKVTIIIAFVLMTLSCTDRAKPAYDECVAAQGRGDLKAAWDACQRATAADPGSRAATAASAKLIELEPALAAEKAKRIEEGAREQAERDARYQAALKAQASAGVPADGCKAGKWVTYCETGGGLLSGATREKCEEQAKGLRIACAPCKCADEVEGAN